MSIEAEVNGICKEINTTCRDIEQLLHGDERDLGGFSVRRLLPSHKHKAVGPWVFFDHAGPITFQPGQGINVRPHPHINLATVTYLFAGEILHRDCLGNVQVIKPGAINLMVAGKGITHSEREQPAVKNQEHKLHGLQLWLALPEESEEIEPAFYHYTAEEIPTIEQNGIKYRVLMGEYSGVTSPVKTFARTVYVEARLQPGQSIVVPDEEERALYVVTGKVKSGSDEITQHSMAIYKPTRKVTVTAIEPSTIVFIGGENVGKRYIEWNFVSSRKERIEQAKRDWEEGKFLKISGDEEEFIPLP